MPGMPARGDIKPRPPPAKEVWLAAFEVELLKLRPHLAPEFGTSKLIHAMAVQAYAQGEPDPVKAAKDFHKRQPKQ